MQKSASNGILTTDEAEALADSIESRLEAEGIKVLGLPEVREAMLKKDRYQSVASILVSNCDAKILLAIAAIPEMLDMTDKFGIRLSTKLLLYGNNDVLKAVNATRAAQLSRKEGPKQADKKGL